jgi:hypothetical protein
MGLMNHNGIDVSSQEEVHRAHAILSAVKEEYRIERQGPCCVLDRGLFSDLD